MSFNQRILRGSNKAIKVILKPERFNDSVIRANNNNLNNKEALIKNQFKWKESKFLLNIFSNKISKLYSRKTEGSAQITITINFK